MDKEIKHFYPQSLPMTPVELKEANSRAISQEDRILAYLKHNEGLAFTAWFLNDAFPEMCITSVRRSLFNLEKQGKVSHAGWVKGPKGVKVGKYIAFTDKLF